jgi:hypothetical protein
LKFAAFQAELLRSSSMTLVADSLDYPEASSTFSDTAVRNDRESLTFRAGLNHKF